MAAYANTHIQLEARRDQALAQGGRGPRCVSQSGVRACVCVCVCVCVCEPFWYLIFNKTSHLM